MRIAPPPAGGILPVMYLYVYTSMSTYMYMWTYTAMAPLHEGLRKLRNPEKCYAYFAKLTWPLMKQAMPAPAYACAGACLCRRMPAPTGPTGTTGKRMICIATFAAPIGVPYRLGGALRAPPRGVTVQRAGARRSRRPSPRRAGPPSH